MMTTIKIYDAWKYKQVWRITKNDEGEVIESWDTGKIIPSGELKDLPERYIVSELPMLKRWPEGHMTNRQVDLYHADYFMGAI